MLFSPFRTGILAFLLSIQINPAVGHGFVHNVIVNEQTYPAWNPFVDGYVSPAPPRVGRKIPSDGPITSVSDPNLACNAGGTSGTSVVANANAGSTVTFQWVYWPGDHRGPVSTYMAACSNNDCPSFSAEGAQWFKIDASGYENGKWAAEALIADSFSWKSTIPKALSPGQYLMRHEIIALHSAYQPQFYPVCIQVNVVGSGSGHPSAQEITAIPGLYDKTTWPNIDTQFGEFVIPGPPVVFSGGNAGNEPQPSQPQSSQPSPASSSPSRGSMPSPVPPNSSVSVPVTTNSVGRCHLVRRVSH